MATYTAWDGNEYPLPIPEGWYRDANDLWWPEGHGPGPDPLADPSELPGAPRATPSGDRETTIYSSPAPSVAGAAAAPGVEPDTARKRGGGGGGRTLFVLAAVLFALLAIGGGVYALLSSDDAETTAPTSTLFAPSQGDADEASPGTTEAGDEPVTTVSVVPGKGSIEDPYEVGEQIVVEYTDAASEELRTWTVEVLGNARDITQAVLDENQFNEAPGGGQRFIGVPIRVTYVSGPAPASLFELTFKAVGPSGDVLTTFDPSCGVVPNALDTFAEISRGNVVEGSICWTASPADAADLTMLIEVFLEDTEIYADLSN